MQYLFQHYGDSKTLPKPRRPLRVDRPFFSRFYVHSNESADYLTQNINFLTEMTKFFGPAENAGYAGKPADEFINALYEYGYAGESPFWEGDGPLPQLWTGEGAPPNNVDYYVLGSDGLPAHPRFNSPWGGEGGRGYTRDNSSDWHRVPRSSDGLPWGFYEGMRAQNLNYCGGADEWNHFFMTGDGKTAGIESVIQGVGQSVENNPLSDTLYDGMFGFDAASYADVWNSGLTFSKNGNTVDVLSQGIRQFLSGFGDQNYYDIVMSGFKNGAAIKGTDTGTGGEKVAWAADNDWDNNDGETFYNGSFSYDNVIDPNGQWAFLMMAALLESRRRIFFSSFNIFGDNQLIGQRVDIDGTTYALPDDQALIANFQSLLNDPTKLGGADPHNAYLLIQFLQMQHSLHSVLPAYSFDPAAYAYNPDTSNGGFAGWVFSGKDQLAFQRFAIKMKEGLNNFQSYVGNLASQGYAGASDFKGRVDSLISEFYSDPSDTQPYIGTGWDDEDWGQKIGWDFYCAKSGEVGPNFNPAAVGSGHERYLVQQLMGMTLLGDRSGNTGLPGGDNLASRNWVVHIYMELSKMSDKDIGRNISISCYNRRKSQDYKLERQAYWDAKHDLQMREADDKKQISQAIARRQADLKKMQHTALKRQDEIKKMAAKSIDVQIREKEGHNRAAKRKSRRRKR